MLSGICKYVFNTTEIISAKASPRKQTVVLTFIKIKFLKSALQSFCVAVVTKCFDEFLQFPTGSH